ncbi:uncharacterized protein B0J16DRAFT_367849 [Fusarium flagelliforme]|uniref:uncharacterized protein n=1 Tax=Fusarium flagelliforme TaxID=2675880 RepID=UPI001E8E196C|nr:uncharacterized protein B0J16DRAFT_367849 [Fusarium flagelliforme]KAH7198825.1 hypothetical protein B0J16DRAFT_367849 [Fusarium flagelliforme]
MSKSPLSIRSLTVALMAPRHLSSDSNQRPWIVTIIFTLPRHELTGFRLTQKQIPIHDPFTFAIALILPAIYSLSFVSISRSLASSYRTLTQKQIVTNSPVDLDGSAALKGTPEPKNVQEP